MEKKSEIMDQPPIRLDRQALRNRKHDRSTFMELPRTPISLVLDGVFGNYNHGAIFRLCDAFMLEKIHFCKAPVKPWHKRFLKSARGTHKWVPYTEGEGIIDVLEEYSRRGYQIVAVEQCEGSIPIFEADLKSPICIVLGGELSGISSEVIAYADVVVELPACGMANSLNVSVSAGMIVLKAYQAYLSQLGS